jgi:hypothetical protein
MQQLHLLTVLTVHKLFTSQAQVVLLCTAEQKQWNTVKTIIKVHYFCMFHPCAGAEVRLTRSSRGRGGGKRSSLRVESRRPRGAARRSPAAQSVAESEAADAPDPLEGEVLGYFITIPGKPPR